MDLKDISQKRQKKRKASELYKVKEDSTKQKFYILDMFPYPSGAGLHVGHPKGYIATDTVARKKMLEGFNVLHPMGFDTFGLGTENYAIEHKMKPQDVAKKNIETYIKQLEMFGCSYDRSRTVNTADPKYFKWTQRIFLQLYNHYYDEKLQKAMPITDPSKQERLAYVDYKPINRCPSCMTGLANEDLDDGKCERCGSEVEQKPMKQRVLRITKYAERLLTGLDDLKREESMKDLERNWIGKSEGTQFKMKIFIPENNSLEFDVYTTRIDTVFGMSFVAIAPEHPLLEKIQNSKFRIQNWNEIHDYQEQAKKKTQLERTELQKDKTGVRIEGLYAINPFNGQKVPVFVADYVLANYGTGVVMAVPAHDQRDFEFAKKYKLPIKTVIRESQKTKIFFVQRSLVDAWKDILSQHNYKWTSRGDEGIDIHISDGDIDVCIPIFQSLLKEGAYYFSIRGESKIVGFKDKIFDIFVQDDDAKIYGRKLGIPEKELDRSTSMGEYGVLTHSDIFDGLTSQEAITKMQERLKKEGIGGVKVNYKMQDRVFSRQRYRGEPFPILRINEEGKMNDEGGKKIIPLDEKDLPLQLPDVEHYEPTGTEEGPLANISDRVNVTLPDGTKAKRETNTMPGRAGSSRYWLRYMDVDNDKALVGKDKEKYRGSVDVYVGGAEHITRHMIYGRFRQKFLYDIGVITHEEPFQEYHSVGLIMGEDGRKMSKRRGNVVNPDDIINEYGTDVLRTYELFMGPFDQAIAWNTKGINGTKKFLDKIILLKDKLSSFPSKEGDHEVVEDLEDKNTQTLLHQTIKKIGADIDGFKFNTAISQLMIFVNHLTEQEKISRQTFEQLVILVSPFAPHLAEELREQLGNEYSIFTKATRPVCDESKLVADEITIAVQVNGKVRGTLTIAKDTEESEVLKLAKNDEKIKTRIVNEPKKVIYVKGKILNIVV